MRRIIFLLAGLAVVAALLVLNPPIVQTASANSKPVVAANIAAGPAEPAFLANLASAKAALKEANDALRKRNFDAALAPYRRALTYVPTMQEAYEGLGRAYGAMKDYDNAVSAYEAGVKVLPESTALWLALGNTYNSRGFFIDPRCGSPHAGIGASPGTKDDKFVREQWIAKADAEYQSAIGAFQVALKLNSTAVAAYDGMAYSYHRQFKHADAIVWANRALEVAPNDFGRYMTLGNSYKGLKDFDTALTYYERAIALKPKDEHAYKYLWETYAGKRDWDGAIARLSQAVATYPDNVEAMMRLAMSYEQKKDLKTAMFWYEQGLKVDPERGEVYKFAAPVAKKLGDVAKSLEYARLGEWYKPK